MGNLQIVRSLRKQFNKPVFALLIFYAIMNAAVMLSVFVQVIVTLLYAVFSGQGTLDGALLEQMIFPSFTDGWGYILAYAVGLIALLRWKKPHFFLREIWQKKASMSIGAFLALLCLMTSMQALYELGFGGLHWLFQLLGLEFNDSAVLDSYSMNSVSMLFYVCILGPIGEEILFRGLLLRSFRPFGKKFSILSTAVLFGLFHGNLLQSAFAVCVGLILGYVTVEYSMGWAVVLHMFNNLILCYLLPMGLGAVSPILSQIVMTVLIWGCAVGTVLLLLLKWDRVVPYLKERRIHPLCIRGFFTSPAMIVFMVLMGANIVLTMFIQLAL